MNRIENFAYLFATMMDSDGRVNVKELHTWNQIIKKRWPEIPEEQARNTLKNSLYNLKSQNHEERINNLEIVLAYLKDNLNRSDLNNIAKDLSKLIQADGLISIGEINLAGLLKWKLGLDINFN
tara:strand:- start:7560 stop:7931 length:372 start_codon:yes stop_codon:yes gene_type:complete